MTLAVRAPATSANLGPGFDSFAVALALHLEVRAEPRVPGGPRVLATGEGADELPRGDDNLVWQSFVALHRLAGSDPGDLVLHVANPIPLERGLGSSAAAIVAGLGLARVLAGARIGDRELIEVAAELEGHPDNVAAAVLGGLVCVADADEPVVRRAQPHGRLRPVALVPPQRQATGAARAVLPDTLPREQVAATAARAGHVLAALAGSWPVDPRLAGDLLHEPPRLAGMPATAEVLGELRAAGVHAWLSGAGPSVCAAVPVRDAAAHERCVAVGARGGWSVRPLRWDLSGVVTTG